MACLVRYSAYSTYSKEPGESGCSVACLVRYSTYSTYSKEPGESGCSVACLVRYSTCSTSSKEPGESGCSVACLVRYSTYSTYSKNAGDCEGSAWYLPRLATWPRLPGIGAEPAPRSGFFLPRSGFRLRSTPRSVFRLRFSFRFCPKNPPEAMRWGAHRFRSWVSSRKPHCRASAEGLGATLSSQHRSQSVFFTIHTSRQSWRGIAHSIQSWRGRRIAPSILVRAQDCHTQSWRGHRIAPLNPGVGAGLPRCFSENPGSAVLYSTTPPDSPPGLRGKHRQCVGTHRCTPGLAARFPASNSGSKGKRVNGENQAVSCARIQQQTILKSGKTVALISLILEQYRGVFERIYIFSPSINVDDGWIPVKKYIEEDLGVNGARRRPRSWR